MEGTDISEILYSANDNTYYGNGCPGNHSPSGGGGYTTACSSRITETDDGETQYIGVYYTFQAATSGSGFIADNKSDNLLIPDSFCPLGWQLPYGGTGGDYYDKSRSWKYLFAEFNFNLTTTNTLFELFREYPFSAIRGGRYYGDYGELIDYGRSGFYHSSTQQSDVGVHRILSYDGTRVGTIAQRSGPKREGQSVRCVLFLASGKSLEHEKQKSRAFVFFADPTRRRGAL